MKPSPLLFVILFATMICFVRTEESVYCRLFNWIKFLFFARDIVAINVPNPTTLDTTNPQISTENVISKLSCVPEAVFMYDHNVCFCNKDGTRFTCKRKMFSTLAPELHQIQLQNITIDCNPGQYFKKPCKECVCHASGKFASCVHSRCSEIEKTETRDKCTPGSVFNNRCNACICGSNGTAACTSLACGLEEWKNNSTKCVPSSSLMVGCNDCSCDKSGLKLNCERLGCAPMSFYHESILNVTMTCKPNETFDYNCHQCICDNNGTRAMCSGKPCPYKYDFVEVLDSVEKCNPGMIFANDCNVCICDQNAKGVCTTFSCDTSYNFLYVDHLDFTKPGT